jgi:hypothetical protein
MSGPMKHAEPDGSLTPSVEESEHGNKKLPNYSPRFAYGVRTVLLDVWVEVIGVLLSADIARGLVYFKELVVLVPPGELLTLVDLGTFVGNRVRLLRTDIPHRPLCIRLHESNAGHRQQQGNTLQIESRIDSMISEEEQSGEVSL